MQFQLKTNIHAAYESSHYVICISVMTSCRSLILAKCELNELTLPPSYMCLSAVARSHKLHIDVTIDQLVVVQRSAIVRYADFLLNVFTNVYFDI